MGQLRHYSMTPHDKPEWLLRLQLEVSQHYAMRGIDNTPEEWMDLLDFIDAFIQRLYIRRDINVRSDVTADLDRGWRNAPAYQTQWEAFTSVLH